MPSSKGGMKYEENHQKRALGVIVADSPKNDLPIRGSKQPNTKMQDEAYGARKVRTEAISSKEESF